MTQFRYASEINGLVTRGGIHQFLNDYSVCRHGSPYCVTGMKCYRCPVHTYTLHKNSGGEYVADELEYFIEMEKLRNIWGVVISDDDIVANVSSGLVCLFNYYVHQYGISRGLYLATNTVHKLRKRYYYLFNISIRAADDILDSFQSVWENYQEFNMEDSNDIEGGADWMDKSQPSLTVVSQVLDFDANYDTPYHPDEIFNPETLHYQQN